MSHSNVLFQVAISRTTQQSSHCVCGHMRCFSLRRLVATGTLGGYRGSPFESPRPAAVPSGSERASFRGSGGEMVDTF